MCPGGAIRSAGAGWPDRSAAGERLDLAALALDVREVPAACDTRAAVLSGVRSGCPVAVRFAAGYPARTQGPGPGGRVREDDPAGRVRLRGAAAYLLSGTGRGAVHMGGDWRWSAGTAIALARCGGGRALSLTTAVTG